MSDTPLNIVFILADDMGYWALGCYGNSEVQTPNLDRIAKSGMRFDNAFCVSPVCSPARASLLTGRIPSQHGVHDWLRRGNSPIESEDGALIEYMADQPAYTEILAKNGYRCGLSGKWHLGNAPASQKGHEFWEVHAKGGGPYYDAPMIKNGEVVIEPGYVTDVITDNAMTFLQEQASEARPFYLGVHYTAPHSPWDRDQHPAEYYDPYFDNCPFESTPEVPLHPWQIQTAAQGSTPEKRREILSGYYGSITAMDAGIGKLLDQLEAMGVAENTLVVFTSDNGMNMGHHGIYGKGNGTYPQNMYDTSVKVPWLMSCPAVVPSSQVTDALFSHYDFFPSLLNLLGLSHELPEGLPGEDCSAFWRGDANAEREAIVVFDEYGPVRMIRDKSYKLVVRHKVGPNEFYDLENDPDETTNLYKDPQYKNLVAEFKQSLEAWFFTHVNPEFDGKKMDVKGTGQLDICNRPNAFFQELRYVNPNQTVPHH